MKKTILKVALAGAIIVGSVGTVYSVNASTNYGTVTVETQGKVELKVDKNDKVIEIIAINEDGIEMITEDMKGKEVTSVVDKLISNAKSKGFVTTEKNGIVVSCENHEKNDDLDDKIENYIKNNKELNTNEVILLDLESDEIKKLEEAGIAINKEEIIEAVINGGDLSKYVVILDDSDIKDFENVVKNLGLTEAQAKELLNAKIADKFVDNMELYVNGVEQELDDIYESVEDKYDINDKDDDDDKDDDNDMDDDDDKDDDNDMNNNDNNDDDNDMNNNDNNDDDNDMNNNDDNDDDNDMNNNDDNDDDNDMNDNDDKDDDNDMNDNDDKDDDNNINNNDNNDYDNDTNNDHNNNDYNNDNNQDNNNNNDGNDNNNND